MGTFEPQVSSFAVEYDASLSDLAILLYKLDEITSFPTLSKGAFIKTTFTTIQDSSLQNLMEFIAIDMAVVALVKLEVRGAKLEITGDNTRSLNLSTCREV